MTDRAQILITAVDQTRQAFSTVNASLEKLSGLAGKMNSALGALGAALSLTALVAAGKHALDTADSFAKMAQKTGVSVESLSLLKPVVEQSGSTLAGLETGLKKLATAMVDAASGSKSQAQAFGNLGIAVRDTAGQLRPTEEVLLDLADVFQAMPDGAEKSALAVKLLGKNGLELIPFLNQGRDGVTRLKDEFRGLGLEVSGQTSQAAEKFNDTLDTVKQALAGIAMKIVAAALPALQNLADALVSVVRHSDQIIAVLRTLGESVLLVLAYRTLPALATAWQSVGAAAVAAAQTMLAAWRLATASVGTAAAAIGKLQMAFLALSAFLIGWEIGTWLSEKFEFVRKAGILMVEGLVKAIEYLRFGWEAFLALFTNDTIDQASARHNARLAEMNQIFAQMYAGASQGAQSAAQAMDTAANAAEAINRRLEAARVGLQTALTQGIEGLHKTLEALKSRLGEVDQAIGKSQAVVSEALARMGEAYKHLTANVDEAMNRQLAAVRARYEQEKSALEHSHATQAQLIARATQLLIEALGQETRIRRQATNETLRLIEEEGQARIEAARRQGQTEEERAANVKRIENEILASKRQMLEQALADYRRHIDALNAEANRHLDEIRRIEDEKRQLAMSTEERIRDIRRQGLSDAEATEDKKRQIVEYQTQAREALAKGEFDLARQLAQKAMDLAAQVASEQTNAAKRAAEARQQAERDATRVADLEAQARQASTQQEYERARQLMQEADRLRAEIANRTQQQDQAIAQGKANVADAIGKIRASEEILNQALDAEATAHQKAAQAALGARDQIQQTLEQTQNQVNELSAKLAEGASLQIDVNTDRLDAALAKVDALFQEQAFLLAVDADLKAAEQKLLEFEQALKEGKTLDIDADVAKAEAALTRLKDYARQSGEFELMVRTDQALAAVDEVRGRLDALQGLQTESVHSVSSNAAEVAGEIMSLNGMNTSSTHTIYVTKVETNATGGWVGMQRFASGGAVSPAYPHQSGGMIPGSGDQDTVPRTLDAGAFVIRKAAVRQYGSELLARLVRYATGGTVPNQPAHFAGGGMVMDFSAFLEEFLATRGGWPTGWENQWLVRDMAMAAFDGFQAGAFSYDEAIRMTGSTNDIRQQAMRALDKTRKYAAGGSSTDTVPALLTPGEYVVRREAVQKHGVGFFAALNQMKLPVAALAQKVRGFARGGYVGPVSDQRWAEPRGIDLAGVVVERLVGEMRRPAQPALPETARNSPSKTVRIEFGNGKDKIPATIAACDELGLIKLLREAKAIAG